MSEVLIDTARFKRVQDETRREALQSPERAEIVTRARLRLVRDQLKEARVLNHMLVSDEAVERGGGDAGPSPLHYFAAAIGF